MSKIETSRAKTIRHLRQDGWSLIRHSAEHDVYRHDKKPGVITIPRHRTLSPGVARSIAKIAGWL